MRCLGNGRRRRLAGGLWRCGVAVLLVLQIVYTPLHLYLEPHTETVDERSTVASDGAKGIAGRDGQDDHGDTDQHSAAQHKLKSLRSPRIGAIDLVCAPVAAYLLDAMDCLVPPILTRSGLSPPELSGSWQFFFRTALPVRAPSLLS